MAAIKQYRTPVFTFEHAASVWGTSYWALSGKEMLDWLIATQARLNEKGVHGLYDHRPSFSTTDPERHVCWCRKPKVGEIPEEITNAYAVEIEKYPSWMTNDQRIEYLLQKSWSVLFFKWDTMSAEPTGFNLLLAKLLAESDSSGVGLTLFDSSDLYVTYNPVEWMKKYHDPYPVDDLAKQKVAYDQWLILSGFRRYYTADTSGGIVATPWYFRAPVSDSTFGGGIKESPSYKIHPLQVTGGTYTPPGYEP